MDRRKFLTISAITAATAAAADGSKLGVWKTLGKLGEEDGAAPVDGAKWYSAEAAGDGMAFEFKPGTLLRQRCLASDMLLDGRQLAVFQITLGEGPKGRELTFRFGALNQCSFRMRLDLALVDQSQWMSDRDGAFLKPTFGGDRVDLAKVDRLSFTILRKGPKPVRWCMTDLRILPTLAPKLTEPVLPKGVLLDEFGQSALLEWPAKTRSVEELKARIKGQFDAAPGQSWPEGFSKWGGWKARKLTEPTGWFRTKQQDGRWWLVDPDGYAFWSAGIDCVRVDADARVDGIQAALKWLPELPEYADAVRSGDRQRTGSKSVNYLAANMIRSLGREGWRDKWARVTLAELKRLRFNTVGNWSDWEFASKAGFPYVRPMSFRGTRCGMVYRDFPDVFHAAFEQDAAEYAADLKTTANDPALIGYFLMNEPTWAFSSELPAAGMLYNASICATREELVRFLRKKYDSDAALSKAWNTTATFDKVAQGKWQGVLPPESMPDLRGFSALMVERYFQTISKACKQVDPNHLNLGMRWQGVPEDWAVPGMKSFDVFSMNCYQESVPADTVNKIHSLVKMPVMVGEWHFGALDVGLPASGIGHLRIQEDRGKAYSFYLEDAAAQPNCVGVHWFTLYDQSALGRFDGENYNIGFLDICNRAYEELGRAAISSHERMYTVASGQDKPFAGAPRHLPKLFL
ncbi:hypothetical protein [Paludibaculum fermentans]|uniref:hypothetical protein n=1 Tax=Paludibaculum fermentans TaxID=1473598 RepID=UPI003EC08A70